MTDYKKMNLKLCTIILSVCLLLPSMLFAQEVTDEPLPSEQEIQTDKNNQQENFQIDKKLQDDFIIIESIASHDLNPQTTSYSSDAQIHSGLYEGLFSYNPVTLDPQYAIATSYKISRDKLRWTFTIRNEAKFSNGESITAEDVVSSWIQLLSTPEAPYSSLFDIIKGAEEYRTGHGSKENVGLKATGEKTLSVHLKTPANYLPRILCHSAFSVVHRNPTVYSGPYILDDLQNDKIILRKNPYYWDYNNTWLEKITFIQSNDLEENTFLYNTGKADWVISGNINTNNILIPNAIQMNAEFGTSYIFFKNKPESDGSIQIWNHEEFRRAVLEAIPWDILRKNSIVPAQTFVFPLSNYPTVEGLSYTDPQEALLLMDEARKLYNIDADKRLPLVLDIPEGSYTEDMLIEIQKALEPLGVDFTVRMIPNLYYIPSVQYSSSDLFSYVWIGDFADPLAFLELFRGDSTLNVSGWKNEQFDNLLNQAAVAKDNMRNELLAQAEEVLLESGMVIPVYHPVSFNVINTNNIGGWYQNAFDLHPLKYIFKKKIVDNIPNVVLK